MAEYCEKCLFEIIGLSPKEAKKAVKVYKKGELLWANILIMT